MGQTGKRIRWRIRIREKGREKPSRGEDTERKGVQSWIGGL